MITHNDTLEAGEEIICIGARELGLLVEGKRYQTLYGLEPGVFADRPYVTVITENGREGSFHASRFRKLTPEEKP